MQAKLVMIISLRSRPIQPCRQTRVLTKRDGQTRGRVYARYTYVRAYTHMYKRDNVSYNNDQLVTNMSDREPQ